MTYQAKKKAGAGHCCLRTGLFEPFLPAPYCDACAAVTDTPPDLP